MFAEDQACTWCGGVCRELVRPYQEYTKVALFKLTGLLLPFVEQWRVLRCEACGHLAWFVVPAWNATARRGARTRYAPRCRSLWLRLYWKRALAAVEADTTLRLHDLRHVTAQLLVNSGASEARVQTTMRHATASMTRRYARQRDHGENAQALAVALGLKASA